ncbi:MAG: protein kinase [Planctomycetes bacterium]|nr:protein kinase [Planctomycetota bacterium]
MSVKILKVLNQGQIARVELCVDDNGTKCVRKVFDLTLARTIDDPNIDKLRARFVTEVRTQQSLPTNLFIPVHFADLDSPDPWFIMPYATNSLREELDRSQTKPPGIRREALFHILASLKELHSRQLVHRDLKPENTLLHEGRWKLSDLGFVKVHTQGESFTSFDSVAGTELYMAPEQFKNLRTTTPAADIYSFGCILHDMVTDGDRVPYAQHSCSHPLSPIIEKCTAVTPPSRFATIESLEHALQSTLDDLENRAHPRPLVDSLQGITTWDNAQLSAFCTRLLEPLEDIADLLYAVDEAVLDQLCAKSSRSLWLCIDRLCEFSEREHGWNKCDDIARALRHGFHIGDLNIQVRTLVALASLGAHHHRFYVMTILFELAGKSADERLAERVALELSDAEVRNNFKLCAEGISKGVRDFHPALARHLRG